jgi:hypothetical protein
MSRSQKLFGRIEKKVPDVVLCKDMLVVLPTQRILRGFLLETTIAKDMVYLWRVVTPLYRPMRRVRLDYSNRIPKGERLFVNRDAIGESAQMFCEIIAGHIQFLRSVERPQDFLRHISPWIRNPSINFRFDLALTYYLIGNVSEARQIILQLDAEIARLHRQTPYPVDRSIQEAARLIRSDDLKLKTVLEQWENQNVETLGLQQSRLAPA